MTGLSLEWCKFVRVSCISSAGNSYSDPDQLDASLGTLAQQRRQEVKSTCSTIVMF